jgi:hypothetical protein
MLGCGGERVPLPGRLRFLDSLRSLGMTALYRDDCDSSTRCARSE